MIICESETLMKNLKQAVNIKRIIFDLIFLILLFGVAFFYKSALKEYTSVISINLYINTMNFIDKCFYICLILIVIWVIIFVISIIKEHKLFIFIKIAFVILCVVLFSTSFINISHYQSEESPIKYDYIKSDLPYFNMNDYFNIKDKSQYNESTLIYKTNSTITKNYSIYQDYFNNSTKTRCVTIIDKDTLYGYFDELKNNYQHEKIYEFTNAELNDFKITKGFYEVNSTTDSDLTCVFIKSNSVYIVTIVGANDFNDKLIESFHKM